MEQSSAFWAQRRTNMRAKSIWSLHVSDSFHSKFVLFSEIKLFSSMIRFQFYRIGKIHIHEHCKILYLTSKWYFTWMSKSCRVHCRCKMKISIFRAKISIALEFDSGNVIWIFIVEFEGKITLFRLCAYTQERLKFF